MFGEIKEMACREESGLALHLATSTVGLHGKCSSFRFGRSGNMGASTHGGNRCSQRSQRSRPAGRPRETGWKSRRADASSADASSAGKEKEG